jgi:hypothetical protein
MTDFYIERFKCQQYVNDETEALLAFQGIAHLSTPAELRVQLVLMTVQGFLTLCIIQNEDLY